MKLTEVISKVVTHLTLKVVGHNCCTNSLMEELTLLKITTSLDVRTNFGGTADTVLQAEQRLPQPEPSAY